MPLSDLSIVNSVFGKLKADSVFLGYLGLTTSSLMPAIVAKIQKEMEPTGLTKDNVPLVCIYPIPGVRSRLNDLIYDAFFEVAIFSDSSTNIKSATTKTGTMQIGERARELLHYVQLGGATFKTEFQSSFQSSSGATGVKKYVMRFKVSEEIS